MQDREDYEPKKMCVYCHAQVAKDAVVCPFCRAHFDQVNTKTETKLPKKNTSSLSQQETLDSLYPPPYQPKMEKIEEEEQVVEKTVETNEEAIKKPSVLVPVFLFSMGSQLLIFSIFLLFFSDAGMLYLRWKSSLWYLYALVSLGFLYTGYTLFSKVEETE